jgi:hypothetical protein
MIENPIYGGAYAYGKTAVAAAYNGTAVSVKIRRKARSDWLALMPNADEGYVSWEKTGHCGAGAVPDRPSIRPARYAVCRQKHDPRAHFSLL